MNPSVRGIGWRPIGLVPQLLLALAHCVFPPAAHAQTFEGYGNISVGGTGGSTYQVTSLADSGPGTLRDGIVNRSGPRRIVFNVAGTITLTSGIVINKPNLTIDGATAPSPGITIKQTTVNDSLIIGGTHDIIITHLRLWGAWSPGGPQGDLLAIDGDSGPDFVAQRIVLDHLTMRGSGDGAPDIFGEVRDVTVSWCLVFESLHPTTITYVGSQVRQRISVHHNVYARNDERNPQVRGDVRDFDFVNNLAYNWGYYAGWGYGLRVRNPAGEASVNANIVNNAFLAGPINPSWGLVYGSDAGADAEDGGPSGPPPPQGTVVTTTNLGSLWVSGNVLPATNLDQYSTVGAAIPIPVYARVTTWPAAELGVRLHPGVGVMFRNATEQAVLDEILNLTPFYRMKVEQAMGGVSGNTNQQVIQLRMRANGQHLVGSALSRLVARDATGANPVTLVVFPTNVANGAQGSRILVVSSAFAAAYPGISADFTMTNTIPSAYLAAGRLTFEDSLGTVYWSLAWGGGAYTGSNLGSTANDADGAFGPPFAGSLPSSTTQALRFSASDPGGAAPSTTNAADYMVTSGSVVLTNNAGVSFTLGPTADLMITKTDGRTIVPVGASLTYTIVASNGGPAGVAGATIVDAPPASLTGVTWTCVGVGGGMCAAAGTSAINDTVTLPVGATVTYTLSGTVSAIASNLLNTATVSAPGGTIDPNLSNNSATDNDVIVCGESVVVPDGRVTTSTLNVAAVFGASLRIGNSYSVEAKRTTGGSTPPGTLTVFSGDDGCSGISTLTVQDTSGTDPGAGAAGTRVSFIATGTGTYFRAQLVGLPPPIPLTLTWSDTTMFSPAWSDNGSFDTFYAFQNTTGSTLHGTLTLLNATGTVVKTSNVTIPAGRAANTNTLALGIARNQTGTAKFTHDGPPGAVVAEAAIANFAITPAYIQPVKFQAVREAR